MDGGLCGDLFESPTDKESPNLHGTPHQFPPQKEHVWNSSMIPPLNQLTWPWLKSMNIAKVKGLADRDTEVSGICQKG